MMHFTVVEGEMGCYGDPMTNLVGIDTFVTARLTKELPSSILLPLSYKHGELLT